MTDVLTIETTQAFTERFREVQALARAGATVELVEGTETFIFMRKPGSGGFLGALRGTVTARAPLAELLSAEETWESAK